MPLLFLLQTKRQVSDTRRAGRRALDDGQRQIKQFCNLTQRAIFALLWSALIG